MPDIHWGPQALPYLHMKQNCIVLQMDRFDFEFYVTYKRRYADPLRTEGQGHSKDGRALNTCSETNLYRIPKRVVELQTVWNEKIWKWCFLHFEKLRQCKDCRAIQMFAQEQMITAIPNRMSAFMHHAKKAKSYDALIMRRALSLDAAAGRFMLLER